MKELVIIGLIMSTVLLGVIGFQKLSELTSVTETSLSETLAKPVQNKVKVFNGTITSVANNTIVVSSVEFSGELIAKGRWFLVAEEEVGVRYWVRVKEHLEKGEALIVMISINRDNETFNILLGLKQGGTFFIRPILVKYSTYKWRRGTFEFTCKLIEKRGYSFIVEKRGFKALVIINPDGKWYKAGQGEVLWRDVVNEFNVGDTLWLCTHNVLIFKKEFAKNFGVNAIIWGFSGAIIDLNTGTALAKYPL